jgi:hypothetical protein
VDQPGPRLHHLGYLGAEASEVGGEDRGRDPPAREGVVGAHTGVSIEWPQCWQSRSSEALIRAIPFTLLGPDRRATTVLVGGTPIVEGGALVGVDLAAAHRALASRARRLWPDAVAPAP